MQIWHLFIKREAFKELPPRVEYSLTIKGLELLPILNMMTKWNLKHNPPVEEAARP